MYQRGRGSQVAGTPCTVMSPGSSLGVRSCIATPWPLLFKRPRADVALQDLTPDFLTRTFATRASDQPDFLLFEGAPERGGGNLHPGKFLGRVHQDIYRESEILDLCKREGAFDERAIGFVDDDDVQVGPGGAIPFGERAEEVSFFNPLGTERISETFPDKGRVEIENADCRSAALKNFRHAQVAP
jgi:hypothetical protein